MAMKGEWRCTITPAGEPSVTMGGDTMMQRWLVEWLDTSQLLGHMKG